MLLTRWVLAQERSTYTDTNGDEANPLQQHGSKTMTATDKDKAGTGKTPAIRDLSKDEIDSVSGGATSRTPGWTDPNPDPVQPPKSPGWTDPEPQPRR